MNTFVDRFNNTAGALNWTNRHTSIDMIKADPGTNVVIGVKSTLGQYATLVPDTNITLVVKAVKDGDKHQFEFAIEQDGNPVDPDAISQSENQLVSACVNQFVKEFHQSQ